MLTYVFAQADAARIPLADASVDLVFGSPPYCDARTYGIGAQRHAREWVDWMLDVTAEALRVSRGLVLWVCAGVTRDRNYWPACEGLLWEGWKRGWLCECPAYWHRSGIAGSGGDQWLRKDVEYVLAFKSVAKLPWSDNTACGTEPKWQPGGAMSNIRGNGERVKAEGRGTLVAEGIGKQARHRETKTGEFRVFNYIPPDIVNPGNLIKTTVGGGNLGHPIAHENEAPFPEALAEFFVKSFCPPSGTVLDPFSGSGTTVAVADRLGRNGIGFDLRASQCELGVRRLTRPHAPVVKASAPDKPMPLFEDAPA
jgi:site-specific DNA-methyltransferase (adenine-specific)/site-specific DNA-methyltransferase (cytosine-N4-specific)